MSAAAVMNAQPHIHEFSGTPDALDKMLAQAPELVCGDFAYCLAHKHFDIAEGEVLLFTFHEDHVKVKVAQGMNDMVPVQFYQADDGSLVPVGFTLDESFACPVVELPELPSGVGVCSAALACGFNESTNEEFRVQRFDKEDVPPPNAITTIVKPTDGPTWCRACCQTNCRAFCENDGDGSGHRRCHGEGAHRG